MTRPRATTTRPERLPPGALLLAGHLTSVLVGCGNTTQEGDKLHDQACAALMDSEWAQAADLAAQAAEMDDGNDPLSSSLITVEKNALDPEFGRLFRPEARVLLAREDFDRAANLCGDRIEATALASVSAEFERQVATK